MWTRETSFTSSRFVHPAHAPTDHALAGRDCVDRHVRSRTPTGRLDAGLRDRRTAQLRIQPSRAARDRDRGRPLRSRSTPRRSRPTRSKRCVVDEDDPRSRCHSSGEARRGRAASSPPTTVRGTRRGTAPTRRTRFDHPGVRGIGENNLVARSQDRTAHRASPRHPRGDHDFSLCRRTEARRGAR